MSQNELHSKLLWANFKNSTFYVNINFTPNKFLYQFYPQKILIP